MNTHYHNPRRRRKSPPGSAVVVVLAFLAIMVLLVASNTKTVNWLRAEVRLTDQRETARLGGSVTNRAAGVVATNSSNLHP